MKKLFFLIVIISFSFGIVFSQSIEVTSPHSGDTWYKGDPYTITWTKSGTQHARVKIRLFNSTGTTKQLEITNDTENDGSFGPWTIPLSVADGDYVIRVKTIDNGVSDDSDIFSVASRPGGSSIVITNPMETGAFSIRGDMTIEWTTSGISGDVRVEMIEYEGSNQYTIRSSTPYNSSPLTYNIPDSVIPGTYRIKISQGGQIGFSGRIGILEYVPPGVYIREPHGGEERIIGTNLSIIWGTPHLSLDVKIELLRRGRKIGTILSRRAPGGGYYTWRTGEIEEGGKTLMLAQGGYSIRICTIDGAFCDISDGTFTLKNPSGIWVFNPKKNETWDMGTYKTIKWNATNVEGRMVKIDLMWGGRSQYRIARSIPASQKEFRWHVGDYISGEISFRPEIIEDCQIRLLQDDGGNSLTSMSKEFKIRKAGSSKKKKF